MWLDYFYTIDKFLICYHLVCSYHYVTAHATLFHQFQIPFLNMNKTQFRLIIWFNYSTGITFFYILNSILLGRFNCTWPPCLFLINLLSLTCCILYDKKSLKTSSHCFVRAVLHPRSTRVVITKAFFWHRGNIKRPYIAQTRFYCGF